MFTVIICDKRIISDCNEKYNIYFKPLLCNKNVAFCQWNSKEVSFDKALPDLRGIISNKREWRAIVVNDSFTWNFEATNKRNPFDYVNADKEPKALDNIEDINSFKKYYKQTTEIALTNPLTRLSIWLCGSPIRHKPQIDYLDKLEDIKDEEYFSKLEELSVSSLDVQLAQNRIYKFEKVSEQFELEGELFNKPVSVIALAERSKDVELESAAAVWKNCTEFEYSRFYLDNLYPDKLRYLLFDLSYIRKEKNKKEYFNFLTLILILAGAKCPDMVLKPNRVYNIKANLDGEKVIELCKEYNSKLMSTIAELENIAIRMEEKLSQPIDRETVEENFEKGITIPVNIDLTMNTDELMAKYSKIGLSRDCPENEYWYWDNQYYSISKLFIKYLREPRRAVKKATKRDFKNNNIIESELALRMNEFQCEDVEIKIHEDEQSMVETVTTRLFNTATYNKRIEKANKELRRSINKRMSKKKTIITGLIATVAYLLGFIPMCFENRNTYTTFLFSLQLTGIWISIFVLIGLIFLFVLRHRLINRFKHFNYEMSGILQEIDNGLGAFSKYLSLACNIMRRFSIFNYIKKGKTENHNILKSHKHDIEKTMIEVNTLFSDFIGAEDMVVSTCEPYDYDFTVMRHYEYDMPYSEVHKKIEFMQPGYEIEVPVDYLQSVTLEREELYD